MTVAGELAGEELGVGVALAAVGAVARRPPRRKEDCFLDPWERKLIFHCVSAAAEGSLFFQAPRSDRSSEET